MTIKEQIRAEIERQKEYSRKMSDKVNSNRMKYYFDGADEVCNQLLSFIDSQSDEQHDEDLETEIATWISAHIKGNADKEMKIVMRWGEDIARHFAEWQKDKMMEEAFRCEIIKSRTHMPHLKPYFFSSDYGKIGDKVKVIVIKEDEK